MSIGIKVRQLRKAQNMSLSVLAEKSGVQIATLSRIEHQKMTGTLESHLRIAKALEIDITSLYIDFVREESLADLKEDDTSTDVFVQNSKSSYEILTKNILSKSMMPILLNIEPEGKTNNEQGKNGSEKFIYVLDGRIEAIINNRTYNLSKSNTLYFDASQTHYFKNIGNVNSKILVVSTPVEL